jgi:7-cyano-7-deazaguanine synthase in queuosine biosynthesis
VSSDTDLVLFSGGVDSTFNLLKRFHDGKKQALLTIHGLDYRTPDHKRFEELVSKTDAFARQVSTARLYVKTYIYNEYKKFDVQPDMGHGFALTAALFLWDGCFRDAEISADHSRYQEYVAYPWGTNSVTNDLFRSASLGLRTSRNEFTRAGKVRHLAADSTALHALSFCMEYSARPHNCGVCRKCVRTKAMFLAELRSIPDIFLDRTWDPKFFKLMNFQKRGDLLVFLDIYHEAMRNGSVDYVPGLKEKFKELVEPSLMQRWVQRFRKH